MVGGARSQVPPISFVRQYLIKHNINSRVTDKIWDKILTSWRQLTPATRERFEARPLLGLHLPRRVVDRQPKAKSDKAATKNE